MPDFLPRGQDALRAWSANFAAKLLADAESFGVAQAAAERYAALHEAFAASLAKTSDNATDSTAAYAEKRLALRALKDGARALAAQIRGRMETTTAQRVLLGLTVPKPRRGRVGAPAAAPLVAVLETKGRVARCRVCDPENPTRGAKPKDVTAAVVFVATGDPSGPPADPAAWRYKGGQTESVFELDLNDPTIPAGATVWVAARWQNARQETGPISAAARTDALGHARPQAPRPADAARSA